MLQNIHGWFSYHSAWKNNLRITLLLITIPAIWIFFLCLTRKEIKNRLSHILLLDYLHEFNNYNIKNSKQIFCKMYWHFYFNCFVLSVLSIPTLFHCFFASYSVIHQFTAFLQLITAAYGWYRTIRTNTEGTIYCNSIRQNTITIVLQ
jgi:hypothetical protein